MMNWLRKRNREILLIVFLGFLVGGVGLQSLSQTPLSPVLIVNGDKVPYKRYETLVQRYVSQEEGSVSPEKLAFIKQSALQELVRETTFLQEADRYGVAATDGEVASLIHSVPAFQKDGAFNQAAYLQYVHQGLRTTPAEFEEERRRDIRRQKLMMLLSSAIRVSQGEMRDRMSRLPAKERAALEAKPDDYRRTLAQEQGNAVFQMWVQQVNAKLKVENRIDRWEKKEAL
jgi:hypothetical protein